MSLPTATEDRMAAHVNGDEIIYHYGKPAALDEKSDGMDPMLYPRKVHKPLQKTRLRGRNC